EALAAVRLNDAGDHLEQGGLARAIAAHERQPVARLHHQLDAGEKRRRAEAQAHVLEGQDGWRHRFFPADLTSVRWPRPRRGRWTRPTGSYIRQASPSRPPPRR